MIEKTDLAMCVAGTFYELPEIKDSRVQTLHQQMLSKAAVDEANQNFTFTLTGDEKTHRFHYGDLPPICN